LFRYVSIASANLQQHHTSYFTYSLILSSRCKMACLEREYRQLWQSIHRGWEWIRNDLRSRLRQKWLHVYVNDGSGGDSEPVCMSEHDSTHLPPVSGEQRERERRTSTHEADRSYRAYHTCEESAEYVRAIRSEAEALRGSLKASETLRKALRKLTSLDWVLCYERYCAETDMYSCPISFVLYLWKSVHRAVLGSTIC
jgi:hypothetical protein